MQTINAELNFLAAGLLVCTVWLGSLLILAGYRALRSLVNHEREQEEMIANRQAGRR